MKPKPKLTATQRPDGSTAWSIPQDGQPKTVAFALPGDAGVLLGELGYRARVVIERQDGGAIIGDDRARLDAILLDASELGLHGTDVRDRAATRHLARARERLAAAAAKPTAKPTKKRTG
jgi:hypothetical protein